MLHKDRLMPVLEKMKTSPVAQCTGGFFRVLEKIPESSYNRPMGNGYRTVKSNDYPIDGIHGKGRPVVAFCAVGYLYNELPESVKCPYDVEGSVADYYGLTTGTSPDVHTERIYTMNDSDKLSFPEIAEEIERWVNEES